MQRNFGGRIAHKETPPGEREVNSQPVSSLNTAALPWSAQRGGNCAAQQKPRVRSERVVLPTTRALFDGKGGTAASSVLSRTRRPLPAPACLLLVPSVAAPPPPAQLPFRRHPPRSPPLPRLLTSLSCFLSFLPAPPLPTAAEFQVPVRAGLVRYEGSRRNGP